VLNSDFAASRHSYGVVTYEHKRAGAYTICHCSCIAPRQAGTAATGEAVSRRMKCRSGRRRWALARSDGAIFRQMTKIDEATMRSRREADVRAPGAAPNAVPQALPLLRNSPLGAQSSNRPERPSSIRKGRSIRAKGVAADPVKGRSGPVYPVRLPHRCASCRNAWPNVTA
jgi:hypothetical protein